MHTNSTFPYSWLPTYLRAHTFSDQQFLKLQKAVEIKGCQLRAKIYHERQ